MKVSVNWLKKFTAVELAIDELVAKIGAQLGAVEEVIDLAPKYQGIRIVQIIEAKPHPNADKLSVYQATDGREQVQVVSGDRNLNVGNKVAWLAPNQTIPATYGTSQPVVLGSRDMRGEISHGMFASGHELDINDDHEGVLVLDTDAAPGTLLAEAYELDDVIIDIENKMFTHRPDCFGLLGVAREVAGIQNQAFHSPEWYLLEAGKMLQLTAEPLRVEVTNEAPMLVPQYLVATMRGIKIKPSPLHMQSYLKRVGIRPINNVVDVTNYVMYLTGQPLHAFDYDKVAKIDGQGHANIVVRTPKENETIELLDGRTIMPHAEAILICSKTRAIAIGGVMGGADTEVDKNTTNIIIESAHFNMYSIRRTSMEHGIFTDAVTRFSKGQSEPQCGVVLAKAAWLMSEYADAQLASELGIERPRTLARTVSTSVGFINDRLGAELPANHIEHLLRNVEMQVVLQDHELQVTAPFWRTDIEIPEDVVEEVGRLHGYGQLPHALPMRPAAAIKIRSIENFKSKVREVLASAGNNELQTYSFVSSKLLEKTGQDGQPAYRIRNALSPELEFIRTSLLPSLLEKVHPNHKAGYNQFGLFEIGKSHNKFDVGDDQLPREHLGLSYIFSANPKAAAEWEGAPYYQVKHHLSYLFERLAQRDVAFVRLDQPMRNDAWWLTNIAELFEPKRSGVIIVNGHAIGVVGEFKAAVRRNFKLPDYIAGFELDLGLLHGMVQPGSSYQPLLRFPATEQDVCFKVADSVTYAEVQKTIEHNFVDDQRLRVRVTPVDIYQKADDPTHKQMTYRIRLQHHERTLTTHEVNDMIARATSHVTKTFGAELV